MESKNSYHVYTQQNTFITEEIWKENGTIDLFIGDIYANMEENLLCFREADIDEFKDLMKDTIIDYINNCELKNGGKY